MDWIRKVINWIVRLVNVKEAKRIFMEARDILALISAEYKEDPDWVGIRDEASDILQDVIRLVAMFNWNQAIEAAYETYNLIDDIRDELGNDPESQAIIKRLDRLIEDIRKVFFNEKS